MQKYINKKTSKLILVLFTVMVLQIVSYISVGIRPLEVNTYKVQAAENSEEQSYNWNLRVENEAVVWDIAPNVYPLYIVNVKGDNTDLTYEKWQTNFFHFAMLKGEAEGYYDITVKVQYGDAIPESAPFRIYYDGTSNIPPSEPSKQLPSPINMQQSQDRLTWDSVPNATGYQIMIVNSIYPTVSLDRLIIDVPENYFLLSDFALTNYDFGKYYFTVSSVGDSEYISSVWYPEFTAFVYEDKIDNGGTVPDIATNNRFSLKEIILLSAIGAIVVLITIVVSVILFKRKAAQSSAVKTSTVTDNFDLDTCTEEQLKERCRKRFKRDVEYKTERAIKHFILKLPHNEIDTNPKQSQMERMRMRKILK